MRESRKLIRAAREQPDALFDPEGGVRVLGVGELLPVHRRGTAPSPPVDIARTIEDVLTIASSTSCTCTSRGRRAPAPSRCAIRAR